MVSSSVLLMLMVLFVFLNNGNPTAATMAPLENDSEKLNMVPIHIQYEFPSSSVGEYVELNKLDIRGMFPPQDILITKVTFEAVYLNTGNELKKVKSFHGGCQEKDVYCFHHTALHQGGSNMSTIHNHNHGAFAGGTGIEDMTGKPETLAFGDGYGIRLRPEALVNSCLHALNLGGDSINFTVVWTVEYDILLSSEPIHGAIMSTMFTIHPIHDGNIPTSIFLKNKQRPRMEYFFEGKTKLRFTRNVKVVFASLHIHWWYRGMTWTKNGTVFFKHTASHEMGFPMEWLPDPVSVAAGELLVATINGKVVKDYPLGLGVILFVVCDDGTDNIIKVEELYVAQYELSEVKFHLPDSPMYD